MSLERRQDKKIFADHSYYNEIQPLRTIMNYQYRFGTPFTVATGTLYHDGGLRRYYQGIGAALIQGRKPHSFIVVIMI